MSSVESDGPSEAIDVDDLLFDIHEAGIAFADVVDTIAYIGNDKDRAVAVEEAKSFAAQVARRIEELEKGLPEPSPVPSPAPISPAEARRREESSKLSQHLTSRMYNEDREFSDADKRLVVVFSCSAKAAPGVWALYWKQDVVIAPKAFVKVVERLLRKHFVDSRTWKYADWETVFRVVGLDAPAVLPAARRYTDDDIMQPSAIIADNDAKAQAINAAKEKFADGRAYEETLRLAGQLLPWTRRA